MKRLNGWRYGLTAGVVLVVLGSICQGLWSQNWEEVLRSLPIRSAIIIPVFMLVPGIFGIRIWSRHQ